ncbi:hypothetical protein [Bradyrhizobium japonicum]|uniref:hypothetical protein n=1 Tax=Bradyrhizobium japonicum TaxID=375 RepID=UPI0012699ADF|nr:hypothetical protein [Bradyrhizobium japonicum]
MTAWSLQASAALPLFVKAIAVTRPEPWLAARATSQYEPSKSAPTWLIEAKKKLCDFFEP